MAIRRFEEIESWQDARELTPGILALSNHKSPQERHGALWEQLTRAALQLWPTVRKDSAGLRMPALPDFSA